MTKRITKADQRALKSFLRGGYSFLRKNQSCHLTELPDEQRTFKWKGKRRQSTRIILGECVDAKTIKLDWRADLVSVLVHELLHALHWDWTEKQVTAETSRLMRVLTPAHARHLLHLFVRPKSNKTDKISARSSAQR